MKLLITGVLLAAQEPVVKDSFKVQNAQIEVVNYDSNSGEEVSREIYDFAIFNKKVDELKATMLVGKKVRATCWTKSIAKEVNGKTYYNIVLNASALDMI